MLVQVNLCNFQKTRLSDDCESSRAMVLELRSQLEDSRAETIALREKRAVADVFSLELKDYEKKVSSFVCIQLNHALYLADSGRSATERG